MDVSIQFIWVQAKEYDLLGGSKNMFSFKTFSFFWLCSVFIVMHRLSLLVASRGYSFCCAQFHTLEASPVAEHGP